MVFFFCTKGKPHEVVWNQNYALPGLGRFPPFTGKETHFHWGIATLARYYLVSLPLVVKEGTKNCLMSMFCCSFTPFIRSPSGWYCGIILSFFQYQKAENKTHGSSFSSDFILILSKSLQQRKPQKRKKDKGKEGGKMR